MKDELQERRERRKELAAVVADTIGIPVEDLVAALKDGQSIAQVAEANDVERQAVVDALVAHGVPAHRQAVRRASLDHTAPPGSGHACASSPTLVDARSAA